MNKKVPLQWKNHELEYFYLRDKLTDAVENFLTTYGVPCDDGETEVCYTETLEHNSEGFPKTEIFIVRGVEMIAILKHAEDMIRLA